VNRTCIINEKVKKVSRLLRSLTVGRLAEKKDISITSPNKKNE